MDKIDSPKHKMSSWWSTLKTSLRGLKRIGRILELDELRDQNRALQAEVERLQTSFNEVHRRAETEWGPLDGSCPPPSDDFYFAFEETYRGGRDMVKSRLARYLPYVERTRDVTAPNGFLDIGCGRGEWLELLKENNIPAHGIDLNTHMIHESRARGLDAEHADILSYLRKLPDESLSGLSGFHIVEHLPLNTLIATLAEAWRALAPGGILILETHRRPIPPPTLAFMIYQAGFKEYECIRVSIPDFIGESKDVPSTGYLNTLAHHITVGQDYALLAFK
jgi:SAM-dependent methyltransferase